METAEHVMARRPSAFDSPDQSSSRPPPLPFFGAFPARSQSRGVSGSPTCPALPHRKSSSSQVSTCSSRSNSRSRRTAGDDASRRTSRDEGDIFVRGRAVSRTPSPFRRLREDFSPSGRMRSEEEKQEGAGIRLERSREESEMLGVSVEFLAKEFLAEVEQHFGEDVDPNYHEINPQMLHGPNARGANLRCPRDGRVGSSYADALDPCHTGKADVLLSWCWSYKAKRVVDALLRWCESTGRDPSTTFVWQCALCCNQFRVEEKKTRGESESYDVLRERFENQVRSTLHVVALLDPWDDPLFIKRVWCIFELYMALCLDGCQLDVILPRLEEIRFEKCLRSDGLVAMWRVFEKLRIQDAEASVEADRRNILKIVDPEAETPEDYDASEKCSILNRAVIQRLQRWCMDTAAAQAAAVPTVSTCIQAANLLGECAEWSRADAVFCEARLALEANGEAGSAQHIHVLSSLANLRLEQGQLEEAAELMTEALGALELEVSGIRAIWDRRLEYASTLRSFGEVKDACGQLTQATQRFEQARDSFETVGATDHPGYASVLLCLSRCYCRRGQHARAEELVGLAIANSHDKGGPLTPFAAELLTEQGRICLARGQLIDASELFLRAKGAFQDTGSTRKLDYVQLLLLLVFGYLEQGGEALDLVEPLFEEAQLVLQEIGATSRLEYTTLPMYRGKLLLEQGWPEQALPEFEAAKASFDHAGCLETPESAWLLLVTGRCQLQLGNTAAALELFAESQSAFEAGDAADAFAQLVLRNV